MADDNAFEVEPRTLVGVGDYQSMRRERLARIAALKADPIARDNVEDALDAIRQGLRRFTAAAHANPLAAAEFTERLSELGYQICGEANYRSIHAQGVAIRIEHPEAFS